jgi:hypothetical protein
MNVALKYRDRVDPNVMLPRVNWREPHNERREQSNRDVPRMEGSLEVVAGTGGKNNGNRDNTKTARRELKTKVGN